MVIIRDIYMGTTSIYIYTWWFTTKTGDLTNKNADKRHQESWLNQRKSRWLDQQKWWLDQQKWWLNQQEWWFNGNWMEYSNHTFYEPNCLPWKMTINSYVIKHTLKMVTRTPTSQCSRCNSSRQKIVLLLWGRFKPCARLCMRVCVCFCVSVCVYETLQTHKHLNACILYTYYICIYLHS